MLPELLLMVTRAEAEAATVPAPASQHATATIRHRLKGGAQAQFKGEFLLIVRGATNRHTQNQAIASVDQNARKSTNPARSGSPAWIRTKTNRVRICCATVTLRD